MSMRPEENEALAAVRGQLNQIHRGLLAVHKELLEHERVRYERQHGRVGSPYDFLQLAIGDPWFAWLKPLTALITQVDEYLALKETPAPGAGEALAKQAKELVRPAEQGDFQYQYLHAIQESPEVASAHGEWRTILRGLEG
jgi:hypothetical protein